MRKEIKKPIEIKGGDAVTVFPDRIEIKSTSKEVFGEESNIKTLLFKKVPSAGLVLSIKSAEEEKAKPVSAKRKKPAVKPKPKPVAKPKKATKKKEEKKKPAAESALKEKNKPKPKKAEKKSLTINDKDVKLVGTGQMPGVKKPAEVYETDNAFYLHKKGKGQKLTRLMDKEKYAAILKKFKGQTLPEEYNMAKIFLMDVFRPKLTDKAFNRFVLIATAQKDFAIEGEGENIMVKEGQETK